MRKFSDLKIKPKLKAFTGEKIPMSRIFNTEIIVLDYIIEPSTKKPGTDRLKMQIKKGEMMHVIFTGSIVLMQMIREVPKTEFPFTTTIINNDGHFEFT